MIGKYGLFGPDEPPAVDNAALVAVIAWFGAIAVAIWQWTENRPWAFATPFVWAILAWALMGIVIAASPAPEPTDPCRTWC